jgi:hypothetical protein
MVRGRGFRPWLHLDETEAETSRIQRAECFTPP